MKEDENDVLKNKNQEQLQTLLENRILLYIDTTTTNNNDLNTQFSSQGKCLYIKLLQNIYLNLIYQLNQKIQQIFILQNNKEIEAKKKHMPLPSLSKSDQLYLDELNEEKSILVTKSKNILLFGITTANENLEITDRK